MGGNSHNQNMCVIMSGGLLSDGSLPEYVKKRCDYAIKHQNEFDFLVVSSSFSLNVKPKLFSNGHLISEASAGFNYLKKNRCAKKVFCEQFSHDTVGSIFFCLDLFANVFDVKKITFVTSDFHRERVEVVSKLLNEILFNEKFSLATIGCESAMVMQERIKREVNSINKFLSAYSSLKTKKEFLKFLFENHKNYNHEYRGSNTDGQNLGY